MIDRTEVKLSARLKKIAEQIPPGSRLADIGSDHALLPVYTVQEGRVTFAVAGEINAGPLKAAQKQIREAGLEQIVFARLGDGLEVVGAGEVNVITIAGMGGSTIESILDRGKNKLAGVEKLILQPNVGEAAVRSWLLNNEWHLAGEHLLEEDGLYYEVLTAVPIRSELDAERNAALYKPIEWNGGFRADMSLQLLMGPHLLRRPDALFKAKWLEEVDKRQRIMEQMSRSQTLEAAQKRQSMKAETEKIMEVLACLHTDKP